MEVLPRPKRPCCQPSCCHCWNPQLPLSLHRRRKQRLPHVKHRTEAHNNLLHLQCSEPRRPQLCSTTRRATTTVGEGGRSFTVVVAGTTCSRAFLRRGVSTEDRKPEMRRTQRFLKQQQDSSLEAQNGGHEVCCDLAAGVVSRGGGGGAGIRKDTRSATSSRSPVQHSDNTRRWARGGRLRRVSKRPKDLARSSILLLLDLLSLFLLPLVDREGVLETV